MTEFLQLIILIIINYITNYVKGECLPDSDRPFTCDDGLTCISYHDVCNNVIDCPDGDDEGDFCCPDGQQICYDWSTCIDYSQICDGKADCVYAEDEKGCPTRTENPFVFYENRNCQGSEVDILRDYSPDGDIENCKDKCSEYGDDCAGFIFVRTGTYADKCFLRQGILDIDAAPYLSNDERDCYSVFSGPAAKNVINQLKLDSSSAAHGVGFNEISMGPSVNEGVEKGVSMMDMVLITGCFIIGILCLGIGVFIGSKLRNNNGKYVEEKEKYINDI